MRGLHQPEGRERLGDVMQGAARDREPHAAENREEGGDASDRRPNCIDVQEMAEQDSCKTVRKCAESLCRYYPRGICNYLALLTTRERL